MILRATLLASLMAAACTLSASAQYDDDIYYNPKKDAQTQKTVTKRTTAPKRLKNMSDMDIDVYNRRGRTHYNSASDTIGTTAASAGDFRATQQIQKFYNPTIVIDNIDQLEYVLENSIGNVEIVTDASGLPYLYSSPTGYVNWRYDPAFSWARAGFWAPFVGFGWGWNQWNYYASWADPWYPWGWGPAGWGWSSPWSPGWGWGWGPSWAWGWTSPGYWGPSWGGAPVPPGAMRPHGNAPMRPNGGGAAPMGGVYANNNHRTTVGSAAINGSNRFPNRTSSWGTQRPATTNRYSTNNHRSSNSRQSYTNSTNSYRNNNTTRNSGYNNRSSFNSGSSRSGGFGGGNSRGGGGNSRGGGGHR